MSEHQTRQAITKQAFRLFLDKGYKNASMSDLVKATHLSKGAFYHYFENKEEIYFEVINTYFISYYQQVQWEEVSQMNLTEIEEAMDNFYQSFVPEILSISEKGMSRYFMLFFEAFDIHPTFKKIVQSFYDQLRNALTEALKKNKIKNPESVAVEKIARFEGMLFWSAIFPENSN